MSDCLSGVILLKAEGHLDPSGISPDRSMVRKKLRESLLIPFLSALKYFR